MLSFDIASLCTRRAVCGIMNQGDPRTAWDMLNTVKALSIVAGHDMREEAVKAEFTSFPFDPEQADLLFDDALVAVQLMFFDSNHVVWHAVHARFVKLFLKPLRVMSDSFRNALADSTGLIAWLVELNDLEMMRCLYGRIKFKNILSDMDTFMGKKPFTGTQVKGRSAYRMRNEDAMAVVMKTINFSRENISLKNRIRPANDKFSRISRVMIQAELQKTRDPHVRSKYHDELVEKLDKDEYWQAWVPFCCIPVHERKQIDPEIQLMLWERQRKQEKRDLTYESEKHTLDHPIKVYLDMEERVIQYMTVFEMLDLFATNSELFEGYAQSNEEMRDRLLYNYNTPGADGTMFQRDKNRTVGKAMMLDTYLHTLSSFIKSLSTTTKRARDDDECKGECSVHCEKARLLDRYTWSVPVSTEVAPDDRPRKQPFRLDDTSDEDGNPLDYDPPVSDDEPYPACDV